MDSDLYKEGMKIIALVVLCVLSILCLCGCQYKAYHYRQWDSNGKLIAKTDVVLSACLSKTEAKDIFVVAPDRMLFVGELSQLSDADSVGAVFAAIVEAFMPWWK